MGDRYPAGFYEVHRRSDTRIAATREWLYDVVSVQTGRVVLSGFTHPLEASMYVDALNDRAERAREAV